MKKLDREQAAVIGAFTGVLCGPFDDLHRYIERVMGRSVWTHEMADKDTMKEIKEAARADFLSLLPAGTRTKDPLAPTTGASE